MMNNVVLITGEEAPNVSILWLTVINNNNYNKNNWNLFDRAAWKLKKKEPSWHRLYDQRKNIYR